MATIYVNDGGSNTSPYDTWAKAATSIATPTITSGDLVLIDSTHAESSATNIGLTTVTSAGPSVPIVFMSVNSSTDVYASGASITTTSLADIDISGGGQASMYWFGVSFISADTISTYGAVYGGFAMYTDCAFELTSTVATDFIACGQISARTIFNNCTFTFNVSGHTLTCGGRGPVIEMYGCSLAGTSPTTLFETAGQGGQIIAYGCDLSGPTYLSYDMENDADDGAMAVTLVRCKTPTNMNDDAVLNRYTTVLALNCDTATGKNQFYFEDTFGTTNEDLTVYRDATYDGTNGYSLKTVTTAYGVPGQIPHKFKLCDIWADTTTSKDFTVHFNALTSYGLDSSNLWIEVQRPNATGPLGTITSTQDSEYASGTPAALSTETVSWTSEPASSTDYKVTAAVSGGDEGVHTVWVCIAIDSAANIYTCPDVDVT